MDYLDYICLKYSKYNAEKSGIIVCLDQCFKIFSELYPVLLQTPNMEGFATKSL